MLNWMFHLQSANLRLKIKRALFFIIISVCWLNAGGQSVGLVLSGGGSKGLAHIGVIKALEENRIPIDYIAGTSMGAIIGSLYAIGMTPDEMAEIIGSEDFNNWLTGNIIKNYRYYFKSEHPDPDIFSLGFDLSDTIPRTQFPLSVIPNHLMDFAFMEIYSGASAKAGYNFDNLFIPFLCIGADISNSKEIVFRKGDLAQAVRASMTFPAYFRPILIDGNIMYDGGIYNNFPLNRLKEEFHPDFIIGSKSAKGNTPPDEFDIMSHIENMVMAQIDYTISEKEGILIDMEFENPSLLDFSRIDEFIEIGYNTTMEKIDSIKMFMHREGPDSIEMKRRRLEFRADEPELKFADIQIGGLNPPQTEYVEKSIKRKSDTIDLGTLRKEYLKLAQDRNLKYIYPLASFRQKDSLFDLHLRIIPQATIEAKLGLFFASSGQSQTFLGVGYRNLSEIATHLKANIQFGRLYDGGSVAVGFDYPGVVPAFFKLSFNVNRFNYTKTSTDFFFEDIKPPYIIQNQYNFRFDVGIPYYMTGIFSGGLAVGRNNDIYYQEINFKSTDTSDISVMNQATVYFSLKSSTLNEKQFARAGDFRKFTLRGGYDSELYKPGSTAEQPIDQKKSYFWIGGSYKDISFFKISRKFTLGTTIVAHASIRPLLSNYYATIIEAPAFSPNIITDGLFLKDYRAYNFLSAGVMPVLNISSNAYFMLEAYGFAPLQEILRDENNQAYLGNYFQTLKLLFSGSLNIKTPVGPVTLYTTYLPYEDKKWIVQLGFGYLLFNRRTMEE